MFHAFYFALIAAIVSKNSEIRWKEIENGEHAMLSLKYTNTAIR